MWSVLSRASRSTRDGASVTIYCCDTRAVRRWGGDRWLRCWRRWNHFSYNYFSYLRFVRVVSSVNGNFGDIVRRMYHGVIYICQAVPVREIFFQFTCLFLVSCDFYQKIFVFLAHLKDALAMTLHRKVKLLRQSIHLLLGTCQQFWPVVARRTLAYLILNLLRTWYNARELLILFLLPVHIGHDSFHLLLYLSCCTKIVLLHRFSNVIIF